MPDEVGKQKRGFPGDPKLVAVKSCCLTPNPNHFPKLALPSSMLSQKSSVKFIETAPIHCSSVHYGSLKLLPRPRPNVILDNQPKCGDTENVRMVVL